MMVSVETLPGLERRMEVSVPAARVRQQVDARLLKVSRSVRIKGFRPGKAPIHVVRKHYGREVQEEVVSDLIRETFAEALRQRGKDLGRIEKGKLADLIVVAGDPTSDVSLFRNPENVGLVLKDGVVEKDLLSHSVVAG